MTFFKFAEWAAANADYDADPAPFWHAKLVPDLFTTVSGILWSISYILMTIRAFKEKSYAMPLYCLCLNITWEFIYGFVYTPGFANSIAFAGNLITDVFFFIAIVKAAPYQWEGSPLIKKHIVSLIITGVVFCTWYQLAFASTLIPLIGRRVVFFSAWPMQLMISIGSIAQILSRGHVRGHTMAIWWTRAVGTLLAGCCFFWRIYYWPERFGYAWTPYGAFLILSSHFFDLVYPFVFFYVRNNDIASSGINNTRRVQKRA